MDINNKQYAELKELCKSRFNQLNLLNRCTLTECELKSVIEEIGHLNYMLKSLDSYDARNNENVEQNAN